ncbi:unnamed protein product [Blepharisma stoltei]|uniref:Tubulin/FtsZ GTPase domain-containing protein n=1 Tax=Blepharisma stoltei TaxID=1481888 RepID=A0AAU9IH83_9CILI|nr:unnamed protein product [Blepharisma stoltei]
MREILSIYIGQAGTQLGSACWELFCLEQGITPNGQFSSVKPISYDENLGTLFSETEKGKYTPRAAFFDLEPLIINDIMYGPYRELYDPGLFISGKEDAAAIAEDIIHLDEK